MAKPLHVQVLGLARALLANPATWTRLSLARTANNRRCEPLDPRAVRFCAHGALIRAAYELTGDRVQARKLSNLTAMWITGTKDPEHAHTTLWHINDRGRNSRLAVVRLFDSCLERV